MLGSVAERVLHRTHVPTLVVSAANTLLPSAVPRFKRIFCGVNLHLSVARGAPLRTLAGHRIGCGASHRFGARTVRRRPSPGHARARGRRASATSRRCRSAGIREHVPDEARQACTIREEAYIGDPVGTMLQVAQDGDAELLIVGVGDRPHVQALWRGHRLIVGPTLALPGSRRPNAFRRSPSRVDDLDPDSTRQMAHSARSHERRSPGFSHDGHHY